MAIHVRTVAQAAADSARRRARPADADRRARCTRGPAECTVRPAPRTPPSASMRFMRSANGLLKAAGMCCEMTIAGASGGIASSTSRIASVPPVDAPMAMMRSVVRSTRRAARRRQHGVGGASRIDLCIARARRGRAACTRACAATLHFRDQLVGVVRQAAGDVDPRLRDEIDRAELERAQRDVGALLRQRGHHHDRHRPQPHQVLEERDAVHARHFHVERDDVRIELLDASRAPRTDRWRCRPPRCRRSRASISVSSLRTSAESSTMRTLMVMSRAYPRIPDSSFASLALQNRSISPATGAFSRPVEVLLLVRAELRAARAQMTHAHAAAAAGNTARGAGTCRRRPRR